MNSIKIVFLTFLSCYLVSCKSIQKSTGRICDVISNNTLYKAINANSIYVLIHNDSAFYEGLEKGKPFYFTAFDTLYKIRDTIFENKNKKIVASSNGISVLTSHKNFKLCKANLKEQSDWNYYKNNFLWVSTMPTIYNQINQIKNDSLKKQLSEEWEILGDLIRNTPQGEFKNKIEEFKKIRLFTSKN